MRISDWSSDVCSSDLGKRNLMFSIKQAGVPLGGVIAGLMVPAVVALAGWRIALFVCSLAILLPTILTWRLSAGLDERPAQKARVFAVPTLGSLRTLAVPLASLDRKSTRLNSSH